MTAEERLKELRKRLKRMSKGSIEQYPLKLLPDDIDLIADLIIERMEGKNARE